jgi:hypothetical protein
MNEAAKRIYVYPEFTHKVTQRHKTDVEYVRADLVDGLVEALEELLLCMDVGEAFLPVEKANEALARAKGKA